jgi:hypothetical protein
MKKFIGILGICFIIIFLIAGCTQQTASRFYTNSAYGFSLNPPVGWQHVDNESVDVAVWFSPVNSSNVSLVVGVPFSLSEGRALSTFADKVEENLSESGLNYTILSRDWRSIPNVQAYEIVYSYHLNGIVQEAKQIAVLRTRTVFLITFTAPITLYMKYLADVNQSIDTFT